MNIDISPNARLQQQSKFYSEQAQALEDATIADRQSTEKALAIWKAWPALFAIVRNASVDANNSQGRIPFAMLARWHKAASSYLVREAERLELDGSAISESSRYCAELIMNQDPRIYIHNDSAASTQWPDMLGGMRYELSPVVQAIVTDGERAVSRLIARLEIAAAELPDLTIEAEPIVMLANEARDKWLYEQCRKGVAYETIKIRLARKSKWVPLGSVNGIKGAANRYAERNNLTPIPKRQHGRPEAK